MEAGVPVRASGDPGGAGTVPVRRILVVEDNPLNMELVCEVLEAHGYEVWQATAAAEALERLKGGKPDLILMDIQLPGLDGLALTRRLKRDPKTRDIQVVALTAHVMKGDRERILEAGCCGYIPKPIDIKELTSQVARFLRDDAAKVSGSS
ncbi:MAG: response regulator [candidate division NC10 bacterium]|nr:response regulator [candidate division NC10 bacterium]MBI4391695.1 response regulator [candidate division NC10 bacterium]